MFCWPERGDDVGRGQALRLQQPRVEVDHHLALLAAVRVRDRRARDGHELGPQEVERRRRSARPPTVPDSASWRIGTVDAL